MNRSYQLRSVFGNNVRTVLAFPEVEWVIVDYGSDVSLLEELSALPEFGLARSQVKIFTALSPGMWHMSKAKNLGHRLASAGYVFNLDADNFISEDDVESILCSVSDGSVCHQFSGIFGDGSHGRIGLPREVFLELGGYDEAFLPMGYQDVDFLNRAKISGLSVVRSSPPKFSAVQNTKIEKMGNCKVSSGVTYAHFNSVNRQLSEIRIKLLGARRPLDFAAFLLRSQSGDVFLLDSSNGIRVCCPFS